MDQDTLRYRIIEITDQNERKSWFIEEFKKHWLTGKYKWKRMFYDYEMSQYSSFGSFESAMSMYNILTKGITEKIVYP